MTMCARVALCFLLFVQATASAQQPVAVPTQGETLAKWPWAIAQQPAPFKQESITIDLAPGEGMEYKYRLEKGAGLLYSWTSTAPIHFELHSEPEGSPRGYAEFFDTQSNRDRAHGVYNAAFPGVHGWWFENKTDRAVLVTLSSAGFYSESREYRKGQDVKVKRFD